MIQLNDFDDVVVIAGTKQIKTIPENPFNQQSIDFLAKLSSEIRKSKNLKEFSDLATFAFWCRKNNILSYKNKYSHFNYRIGKGLIFHISPSNVPLNFAYSFIFGLLSGNSNIIRVPSKNFQQLDILISHIKTILEDIKFKNLYSRTAFIKYSKSSNITDHISAKCDVRLIWGGDETINEVRKSSLPTKSIDITFSDRYSFALLNSDYFINQSNADKEKLYENFYNDTYLMDQNACSSPHIIFWTGKNKSKAKDIFWNGLNSFIVKKEYIIEDIIAMEKHLELCKKAIDLEGKFDFFKYDNNIYLLSLDTLPEQVDSLRGKCGFFYQYDLNNTHEISSFINTKFQTLAYYGFDKDSLAKTILDKNLMGVDRIVPIGRTLDIDLVWDGYDMISCLSREISTL